MLYTSGYLEVALRSLKVPYACSLIPYANILLPIGDFVNTHLSPLSTFILWEICTYGIFGLKKKISGSIESDIV